MYVWVNSTVSLLACFLASFFFLNSLLSDGGVLLFLCLYVSLSQPNKKKSTEVHFTDSQKNECHVTCQLNQHYCFTTSCANPILTLPPSQPPIKPPSDLPTTFTLEPYPSRASAPLTLHAHSHFFISCHPQLSSRLHYNLSFSPFKPSSPSPPALCPSQLHVSLLYIHPS